MSLLLVLLGLSCPGPKASFVPLAAAPVEAAPAPESWRFELRGSFRTLDGPEPLLVAGELEMRGELDLGPGRGFRDGSTSRVASFRGVEMREDRGRWLRSGLDGRSVELRRFDDGELLATGGAGHLGGPGRWVDLFDFLLPALSVPVPAVEAGAARRRRIGWPFMADPDHGWRGSIAATWTLDGPERLGWRGPATWSGGDLSGHTRISASGRGAGELLARGGTMLAHRFAIQRIVSFSFLDAGLSARQRQVFEGRLVRVEPAAGRDTPPLPLYLDEAAIEQAVLEHARALSRCSDRASYRLSFTVEGSGAVRDPSVEGGNACALRALDGLRLPPHREEPLRIERTVLADSSGVVVLPSHQGLAPPPSPMFLYLPGELSPAGRRALLELAWPEARAGPAPGR